MNLLDAQVSPVVGDLDANYAYILAWALVLALADDEDPKSGLIVNDVKELEEAGAINRLIAKFEITSPQLEQPLSVDVGPGSFKTAMLLYYLSREHHGGNSAFMLSDPDREFILAYYKKDQIDDALDPEKNNHASLRALLCKGEVRITISAT